MKLRIASNKDKLINYSITPMKNGKYEFFDEVNNVSGGLFTKLQLKNVLSDYQISKIKGTTNFVVVDNVKKKADGQWAGVILQQLGGNKFIAMTGAKNFVKNDSNKTITFKIGRNAANINHVRIRLTSMDVYEMDFFNARAGKLTLKKSYKNVYNDQLQDLFTEATGLYTSLGTMGR